MATLSDGPTLSLPSLLLLMYLQKPFFLPLTSSASFNSSWALAFLCCYVFPHTSYSSQAACPHFHCVTFLFVLLFELLPTDHNASSRPAHLISSPCPMPTLRAIPPFTWSPSRVTAHHFDDTDTFLPYSRICNSKHDSVTCKIKSSTLA